MNMNEVVYYNVDNRDIRASLLIRFLALKDYIKVTNGYMHPKHIKLIVYGYLRALIAHNSLYSHEFYRNKNIFNAPCLQLSCILSRFEESHREALGPEREILLEELYGIIRNTYYSYIHNNPAFKDAVILCNYDQDILTICSVGTIHEFRYRELSNQCILRSNTNYQNCNL